MLDVLTGELIGRRPIVTGGDFNAWATEWGSRCTNTRGASLLEALATLEVELSNFRTTSTFRRDGRESIIDVTFCSPSLRTDISWRVCEEFTYSDHQVIRYTIGQRNPVAAKTGRIQERQWKMEAFDKDLFVEALRPHSDAQNCDADELTEALTRACDTTMPRKVEPRNRQRPVYWWNESLNALRANCNRARRCFQRAKSTDTREERRSDLRVAKAALKHAIKQSKTNSFKELYLKMKKAPGPDGIPNAVLKEAIHAFPDMFRTVMQNCLSEGHFPDKWKIQKLVLSPKPGKPPGDPALYRPICLLDKLEKLLDRIILNRLSIYTEGEYGLTQRQFGFRKGRSTLDAIRTVVETAQKASKHKRRGNRYCAVVTIDHRSSAP
ncbi:uncharacterized protein LOC128740055 [Sabethes cyaneus]|uniref:uncharacterized protein LOC128740055 n=1 Tax=Sabethes cyaneus TaxID=53552 RepID=UPI00237E0B94|nr:uncharacterized protein LOC128740055 [Sabethes cyaneus]